VKYTLRKGAETCVVLFRNYGDGDGSFNGGGGGFNGGGGGGFNDGAEAAAVERVYLRHPSSFE